MCACAHVCVCEAGGDTKTTDKAMAPYLIGLTGNIRGSKVKISKSNIKEKQEEKNGDN